METKPQPHLLLVITRKYTINNADIGFSTVKTHSFHLYKFILKASLHIHKYTLERICNHLHDGAFYVSICNRMGQVKLRINITRVFRNCRNCPSCAATRVICAISENTSDINP